MTDSGAIRPLFLLLAALLVLIAGYLLLLRKSPPTSRESSQRKEEAVAPPMDSHSAPSPGAGTTADALGGTSIGAASEPPDALSVSQSAGEVADATARPPHPADNGASVVTFNGVRSLSKVIDEMIDQCGETAMQKNPELKGELALTVVFERHRGVGNIVARADLDEATTTVKDPELIECATESVFAAEEVLQQLAAMGDGTGGTMHFGVRREYPPKPRETPEWPANDSSPECEEGTTLHGELGKLQWCEKPDGSKHGEEFHWADDSLQVIMIYENGTSNKLRMRPEGI